MVTTTKKIKLNLNETGEYTIEEILTKYEPYIRKTVNYYNNFLKKFIGHAVYVDFEDLEQICKIGIIKAYERYDIEYVGTRSDYNQSDPIGFYPYLDQMAQGELRRYCRDILQMRRKDIDPSSIFIDSMNRTVNNTDKGNAEIELIDTLDLVEKDSYEDLENKLEVERLLSFIPERDKDIVIDSFFYNLSQQKIAEKYKVSQAQISRVLRKSIKIMRTISENKEKETITPMRTKKVKAIEFDTLFDFLNKGVQNYYTLDKAIHAYCNQANVLIEDAYEALNKRKASHEMLKNLYSIKRVPINPEKPISKTAPKKTAKEDIKEVVEKAINEVEIVDEVKTKPVEVKPISSNIFDSIKIVNLTVDIEGIEAKFSPKGISLANLKLEDLSIEDLKKLQKSIQKVIEINSTIYK